MQKDQIAWNYMFGLIARGAKSNQILLIIQNIQALVQKPSAYLSSFIFSLLVNY